MVGITICVLTGLPAVGKTTFTQRLKQYIAKFKDMHLCIIEYDRILPEKLYLTDQTFSSNIFQSSASECNTWKDYRNQAYIFAQNIINYLKSSEKHCNGLVSTDDIDDLCSCFKLSSMVSTNVKHFIVIDDNMFYRSMRYAYYQLARLLQCSYCQLYFEAHIESIIKRNKGRINTNVTSGTILKMQELLEQPDDRKHRWEESTLVIPPDSVGFSDTFLPNVVEFLIENSRHVVQAVTEVDNETKEADKRKCMENLIHQSDQILRKFVSQEMLKQKEVIRNKEELKEIGKSFNDKRKRFLELMKKENVEGVFVAEMIGETLLTDEMKFKITKIFQEYMRE